MLNINSKLLRSFEKSDIEKLRKAIIADDIIIQSIEKLINITCSELMKPNGINSFEKQSWALEKAYREGGAYHLQQILNLFKEKK